METKNKTPKKVAIIATSLLAVFSLIGAFIVKNVQDSDKKILKILSGGESTKRQNFGPHVTSGIVAPEDVRKKFKKKKEIKQTKEIQPLSGEVAPEPKTEKPNPKPLSGGVMPEDVD